MGSEFSWYKNFIKILSQIYTSLRSIFTLLKITGSVILIGAKQWIFIFWHFFIFKLNSWTLSFSIFSNLFPSFHLEDHALMVINKFIATVNRPFHAFQINQSNYWSIHVSITVLVVWDLSILWRWTIHKRKSSMYNYNQSGVRFQVITIQVN